LLGIADVFAANREIGAAFDPDSSFGHYWAVETAQRDSAEKQAEKVS
jgi:hypothetical protein